jgi:hypothetical protein
MKKTISFISSTFLLLQSCNNKSDTFEADCKHLASYSCALIKTKESNTSYSKLYKEFDSVRIALANKYPKLKTDKATQKECDEIVATVLENCK